MRHGNRRDGTTVGSALNGTKVAVGDARATGAGARVTGAEGDARCRVAEWDRDP